MTPLFASEHAGMIGLLFFFIFFTATALWVYRPGKKEHYQHFADIPFKENDE